MWKDVSWENCFYVVVVTIAGLDIIVYTVYIGARVMIV